MSLRRKIALTILCSFLCMFFAASGVIAYAYFSNKEVYDGFFSGQVELLFDRLDDTGITNYTNAVKAEEGEGSTFQASKDAQWGTKEYPYVISNVRHLYNLSELQRLGYFYNKFIKFNTDTDFTNIPYFLVCDTDYTPKLIDGSNFKAITAIGTDKYPFIGSVKGVEGATNNVDVNGKMSNTSTVHNIKVSGNPAYADAGLFGVIGHLGTAPEVTEQNPTPTFTGQISTISNLVLSNVQVVVRSSLWDAVVKFLEDIAINATEGHKYSYSELHGTADYDKVVHENHHIGILAGHAAYAKIEYISVYYASDSIVAIDLTDSTDINGDKANYLSATGILGFIDNINPNFTVDANGNHVITAGSGDSLGDISYGMAGGGGTSSGQKAGYVLAGEMYGKYCYTGSAGNLTQDTDGTIFIKDALDKDGNALCTEWVRDRILWGTQRTGRYYFYDGVFTFALSDAADIIEPTWDIVTDKDGNPILVDNNYTYDIPDFTLGQADPTKWQTNTTKGNKAIVAYIKKVTSDEALQSAIGAGKQIFIMKEDAANLFLMSLYEQSTAGSGNFESKYTTNGTTQQFASDALVSALATAYESGELKLPTGADNDMTADYNTEDKVAAGLKDGTLKAINVGITSSGVSLDDLKKQYKIKPNVTGNYTYFSGDTPVSVNDDGTISQYYDYATSGYDGYIYYTQTTGSLGRINYEYFWQPIVKGENGEEPTAIPIGTGSTGVAGIGGNNIPQDKFSTPLQNESGENVVWQGETVYTYTYNGETYTGVVVNKSSGTFYGTNNTANANSSTLTKSATGTNNIYYFYYDITTKVYGHSTDGTVTYNLSQLTPSGEKSPSGKDIYQAPDGKTGVLLDRYPTYTFSAKGKDGNDNYLRMIRAVFGSYGTHYVLWNGSETEAGKGSNFTHTFTLFSQTPTVTNSTQATLRFDADGTCYIQYSIGSTGLYVNSSGSAFNTATSNTGAGAKLCIYTVEGTQDITYSRITFDPIDDPNSDTDSYTFSAGEYVLFANPTHTGGAGNITATTTGYTAMPLATDTTNNIQGLDWNNGAGTVLSQADLLSKFKMTKGITFGASFNLLNGTLGSSGIITAPVGTDGVEANIPMACVAFKINKPIADAKIRVIVSVAVSEFYPGEEENGKEIYELGNYTRYFNLWKMEQAGESILQIFNATGSNLLDRFEVPRSHPYQPGTTPDASTSEFINVKYGGNDYRCYLNGDRVLIAYEFNVDTTATGTGTGVYCLGMCGLDSAGDVVANVPMEIVYFSADGVASSGRDGASGSQIGTIDFVYDYGGNIITVKDSSATDSDGNEDYNTYYPSYCLLYFTNAQTDASGNTVFVDVNNERIVVYRYIAESPPTSDADHNTTTSLATIYYKLDKDTGKYVKVAQYSRVSDNVIGETTETIPEVNLTTTT